MKNNNIKNIVRELIELSSDFDFKLESEDLEDNDLDMFLYNVKYCYKRIEKEMKKEVENDRV